MKILSKLKLLFTPTDEYDAVNKKYVDGIISSANNTSVYYGSISLTDNNSAAFSINNLDEAEISTHVMFILKSDISSSITDNYTKHVVINSSSTSFSIVDK